MRILLFLLLLCPNLHLLAQNKIMGYVKLQNSGKAPLPNVEVYALGAATDYTNDKGYFELTFPNKKAGDLIASIEFSLDGYRVINEDKCVGLSLPNDPTLAPLMVVMSSKKDYRTQKGLYYNTIVNNVNQSFEAERKALQTQIDQLVENDQERRILLSKIAELEEEKEELLRRAEKLAEQFADINVDAASQLAKDALTLFKAGKVAEAIALMDDEILDKNMREAKKAQKNHQEGLMQADSAIQQGVTNYMIKARMQKADLQWKAAYGSYLKAIEGDSTDVRNLWEVAYFMSKLNDQKRAIKYYEQALLYFKNEGDKASLLNNLGNNYYKGNDYPKAEKAYLAALEIRERLAQTNPQRFEPDVAMTQNNLGAFYYARNDYPKAEKAYLAALEIKERLSKRNPAHFEPEVALTQNNLGAFYSSKNEYPKAEKAYLAALEIYERLAQTNPQRFEPDVATTQNNLGNFYSDKNDYPKAEKAYLAALEIRQRLAQTNPQRFEPNLANTHNNLGAFYADKNDYAKAEKAYLAALEIYQGLAQTNPQRSEPDVVMTQHNLGIFYFQNNQSQQAIEMLNKSLPIYRKLASKNPEVYDLSLARTLIIIGLIKKETEEGKTALLEVKEIAEKYANIPLAQTIIGIAEENLAEPLAASEESTNPRIEEIKNYEQKVEKSEAHIDKVTYQKMVVAKLEELRQSNPENTGIINYQANAYSSLAWFHLFTKEFAASEVAARKALEMSDETEWVNTNLALALLYQGKYKAAKTLYLQLKDMPYGEGTYKTVFLQDLAELEEAGVTHQDVKKIRALLEK